MDPRRHQEQIGLFPANAPLPDAREIEAIRLAAMQARDEAIAVWLRQALASVGRILGIVAAALVAWPERRATYERLRWLSDRELSDIGLDRGDIAKVFDPEFRLPAPRPANDAARSPTGAPQAA